MANRIDLRIAGYHLDAPVFDPQADDAVEIRVASHRPDRRVNLRVVSTRPRDYFQMDTSSIADDGTFSWPMDVVRLLDEPIRPYDTAAVACAAGCDGGRSSQATLLPVRFSAPKAGQAPVVLAVADVELSQLTATLRQGDKVIYENLAVGGRYLPPHKPIRVPIKGADPGEAVLSLSALTGRNQRDFLEAVLIVPGRHE